MTALYWQEDLQAWMPQAPGFTFAYEWEPGNGWVSSLGPGMMRTASYAFASPGRQIPIPVRGAWAVIEPLDEPGTYHFWGYHTNWLITLLEAADDQVSFSPLPDMDGRILYQIKGNADYLQQVVERHGGVLQRLPAPTVKLRRYAIQLRDLRKQMAEDFCESFARISQLATDPQRAFNRINRIRMDWQRHLGDVAQVDRDASSYVTIADPTWTPFAHFTITRLVEEIHEHYRQIQRRFDTISKFSLMAKVARSEKQSTRTGFEPDLAMYLPLIEPLMDAGHDVRLKQGELTIQFGQHELTLGDKVHCHCPSFLPEFDKLNSAVEEVAERITQNGLTPDLLQEYGDYMARLQEAQTKLQDMVAKVDTTTQTLQSLLFPS